MTEQTAWLVAVVAVLAAALIGFFIGRQSGGGKKRLEALESENARQKEEISGYRREVEAHFDKSATLFASMAGSYKELFEHLSSGYAKLSEGSARELFRDRIAALLLEGGKDGKKLLDEGAKSPSPAFDREGFDRPATGAATAATGGVAGADQGKRGDAAPHAATKAAEAKAAVAKDKLSKDEVSKDAVAKGKVAKDAAPDAAVEPAEKGKKIVREQAADTAQAPAAQAGPAVGGGDEGAEKPRDDEASARTVRASDDTK